MIKEIVKLVLNVMIKEVLPKLEIDIENLLQYTLDRGLKESAAFQTFGQLPGAKQISSGLSQEIAKQVYQNIYNVLATIIKEDQVFDQLLGKTIQDFRQIMGSEIKAQKSMKTIEYLLTALLEEVKVNYVERLAEEDIEEVLEQKRSLLQAAEQVTNVNKY